MLLEKRVEEGSREERKKSWHFLRKRERESKSDKEWKERKRDRERENREGWRIDSTTLRLVVASVRPSNLRFS